MNHPTQNLNEAEIRLRVNKMLEEQGWDITDPSQVRVEKYITEENPSRMNDISEQSVAESVSEKYKKKSYWADYVLFDHFGAPIAVIECKRPSIDPYVAKKQSLPYAKGISSPFIFLTNSEEIYFWDYENADARKVLTLFTRRDLERLVELRKSRTPLSSVEISETYHRRGKIRYVRDYQQDAMKALDYAYELGKRRFLIHLPTGTGKTDLTVLYLERLIKSGNAERVLFLVDREELAKQAIDAIQDILSQYTSYWLKAGTPIKYKQITVCLLQTMINNYKEFSSGFFDVVVADECHRSIYGVWQVALDHFDAFNIGLTATPNEFIERNTYRFYHCKGDTPDFHYDIKTAFEGKYLAPYTFSKSITKILTEGVDVEELHYDPSEYYRKFTNRQTDEMMMQEFEDEAWQVYNEIAPGQKHGPGKTIIFAINKRHASRLAQILNDFYPEHKGRYAEVITSDVKDVHDVIRRFKREEYPQIAVSVGMLDTGFDCPEVIHLVMARPVKSPILYQQMRGRGTRRADHIGKERFMIYDFFGNHDYFNDSDTDPFAGAGWGYVGKEGERKKYKERVLKELDIEDEWIYRGKTIDYGPEGEEIDKREYITNWEKAIIENFATDPLVEKIRAGEDLTEAEADILSTSLNQPELYFNEQNLRRAYRQPLGSMVDFVKHALGIKKFKSVEEQVKENFEAWVITQDLSPEQADFMRLLRNRFIANGKATVKDLFIPPLSHLSAARRGVQLFGEDRLVALIEDLNHTIFERMKIHA